jgi:enterochelin esterase-like enzyme
VIVVLPPSYERERGRRYPVVYALHGYSISAEQWIKEIHVPQTVEGAFARGTPEMIVVLPSSKNVHNGSFYSNSVTTGNFENFIAGELIDYIDQHYRTLARPESRGLVGHSMGGYGAARIGIRRADRYGALYLMSPCCQAASGARGLTASQVAQLEALPSAEAASALPFGLRGTLALASAWSPNPTKPPLYIDLPVDAAGKERPEILAKWAANAPLAFLDQYVSLVRKYRAIALDVGDKDGLVNETRQMHQALQAQGISSTFEIYPGDHTSHVAFRIQDHVLPFFGRSLSFKRGK